MKSDLFAKKRLTPAQIRAVAQRRLDDAMYLADSGQNARANGAIYLGGFALECWLKALLLEAYRSLQAVRQPDQLSPPQREIWDLIYRLHDLSRIYRRLPHLTARIKSQDLHAAHTLESMCEEWTIYVRYSPVSANIADARVFLEGLKRISRWLK